VAASSTYVLCNCEYVLGTIEMINVVSVKRYEFGQWDKVFNFEPM
jgi:hypothetical protein